ncbi:unnamed protein product [Parnassius apollo]|uniref:(apollo) hypothetical protein n=1 Tax=Parnassius apollo TaxID=110799 RepID=A0A8S3Y8R0_PARAO|nr:unnamed protein product [Parnassius apollo]
MLRLDGRNGQQGFKGQAILFAQQVEEVAEQLPLSVANMGFTIVTEILDNVTGNRRYSVDTERIKKHLYVDISLDPKTYGQTLKKEYISDDPNKTGGIANMIKLGIGSRAMLRRNINVNHGLVNGAMRVLRNIEWPALR